MIKYTYLHRCGGCDYDGEVVHVRPEIRATVFFLIPPRCVEKNVELELVEVTDE